MEVYIMLLIFVPYDYMILFSHLINFYSIIMQAISFTENLQFYKHRCKFSKSEVRLM